MRGFVKEDLEAALQARERERKSEREREREREVQQSQQIKGEEEEEEDEYGRTVGKRKRSYHQLSASASSLYDASSINANEPTQSLPSMGGCGEDTTPVRRCIVAGKCLCLCKYLGG